MARNGGKWSIPEWLGKRNWAEWLFFLVANFLLAWFLSVVIAPLLNNEVAHDVAIIVWWLAVIASITVLGLFRLVPELFVRSGQPETDHRVAGSTPTEPPSPPQHELVLEPQKIRGQPRGEHNQFDIRAAILVTNNTGKAIQNCRGRITSIRQFNEDTDGYNTYRKLPIHDELALQWSAADGGGLTCDFGVSAILDVALVQTWEHSIYDLCLATDEIREKYRLQTHEAYYLTIDVFDAAGHLETATVGLACSRGWRTEEPRFMFETERYPEWEMERYKKRFRGTPNE